MSLRISRALADEIRERARAAYPLECCGLLLGAPETDTVSALVPAANVASDPAHCFEIDPAVLIAAHKAARAGGPAILGAYHSHPDGDPVPSPTDAAMAEARGEVWLVCGAQGALRAWIARPGGAYLGCFDEVAITPVPETRPCADASRAALERARNP
jgi:proteasome lid subunit RPN8/RPN11